MSEHTPMPWMTQKCGELLPDDVMIVADLGKNANGIQLISTVARALSIRQSKEVTASNAAFICRAVNAHEGLVAALEDAKTFMEGVMQERGDSGVSFLIRASREALEKAKS